MHRTIYRILRYLRCRSGHWRRRSMKLRPLKGAPTVGAMAGRGSLASWAGPNQSGEERRGPIPRRSREEGRGGAGEELGRAGVPAGRDSRWTREAGTGRASDSRQRRGLGRRWRGPRGAGGGRGTAGEMRHRQTLAPPRRHHLRMDGLGVARKGREGKRMKHFLHNR